MRRAISPFNGLTAVLDTSGVGTYTPPLAPEGGLGNYAKS